MENKKKDYIQIVVLIVILVITIGYNIYSGIQKNKILEEKNSKLVENPSIYYTVVGCINKFITHSQTASPDDIIYLLDENYVNENKINSINLFEYMPKLDSSSFYFFVGEKMRYYDINKYTTKYFVEGKIRKETFEGMPEDIDFKITIILHKQKKIYSVILEDDPYEN